MLDIVENQQAFRSFCQGLNKVFDRLSVAFVRVKQRFQNRLPNKRRVGEAGKRDKVDASTKAVLYPFGNLDGEACFSDAARSKQANKPILMRAGDEVSLEPL